ncbi:hypothetical protein [[Leptolyngbya] sp. PCC 7376]|nr:hypothetical protein [[Leptolyngbya] sp. PCC 7376]
MLWQLSGAIAIESSIQALEFGLHNNAACPSHLGILHFCGF